MYCNTSKKYGTFNRKHRVQTLHFRADLNKKDFEINNPDYNPCLIYLYYQDEKL